MLKSGLAKHVKFIVSFDVISAEEHDVFKEYGINLMAFDDVRKACVDKSAPWDKHTELGYPLFSYTSGTTGDSKGVKLKHRNLVRGGVEIQKIFVGVGEDDSYISYMHLPHSFE